MTIGTNSTSNLRGAILLRGRMALEALKSREQAALFHAAYAELRVALIEAESGNDEFLQRWLSQYRSLMEQEPELQEHLASVQHNVDIADAANRTKAEFAYERTEDCRSPWSAMIAGAQQRAKRNADPVRKSLLLRKVDEPLAGMMKTEPTALAAGPEIHKIPETTPEVSTYGSLNSTFSSSQPLVIPGPLQATLQRDHKATFKKRWTWLSSAFIGSTAAHLAALIGMSVYMIHLARNPEPKAIIASAVESEAISMEAPMEISTSDAPTLDPSETPMPTLPTFAAASAAGSDIQLPASMTGLVTGDTSSPANNAIQQATNSPMSNAAANSVQFFGVKAAGNTFCYVVDGSPSMNKDGAFAAAKTELVRSLSLLKPKQRFYISFFGGEIERLKLGGSEEELYPIYATPENLQKTLTWIDRVRVQKNGLPPNNALNEAIKMNPDGIFLLFDGDTKVDVAAFLRKTNRSDDIISGGTPLVSIHTVGFYTQEFESLMKRIASENNGVYRFVPNPKKMR